MMILIVEDEAIAAMNMRMQLERAGHQVIGPAPTGEDAVELADKAKPDFIIMDINLAGRMDGIDAAQIIFERNRIPLVFVTGYQDEAMKTRAMKLNPVAFLVKPISIEDIDLLLRKDR